MKKILISLALVALMLTSNIFVLADYTKEADILNGLGLFRGTDDGYDLDKTFTRAQGAVMLVRLLGKEDVALQENHNAGFDDVPSDNWAAAYVGYCAKNSIAKGTSATTFEPDREMSAAEYISLLLRSIGYENVNPDNAYIAAPELGLVSSKTVDAIESKFVFIRDDMVLVSYNALRTIGKNGETLVDNLIESGVVSRDNARKSGLLDIKESNLNIGDI